jgi:hypothetical protein
MAYIEKRRRTDGGISARVKWRLGGTRDGAIQLEVFSAGTDAQNLARADGFKKMVDAAGQRWPTGWVKGEGFVRPVGEADPLTEPPRFVDIGEEYVRQIVDVSPGQRKRYLGHLRVLEETKIRGTLIFTKPVTAITEADLKDWLIDWDRSLKTKANYHGLIYGVFGYAVKRGWMSANPAVGTAPRMSRVKQSRPELRFLTERERHLVRPRARHVPSDRTAAGSSDVVRRAALGCQEFTKDLGSAGDVMLREGLENGATLPIFLGTKRLRTTPRRCIISPAGGRWLSVRPVCSPHVGHDPNALAERFRTPCAERLDRGEVVDPRDQVVAEAALLLERPRFGVEVVVEHDAVGHRPDVAGCRVQSRRGHELDEVGAKDGAHLGVELAQQADAVRIVLRGEEGEPRTFLHAALGGAGQHPFEHRP